ncbi:putative DNA-binding transcriptional regulator YafY [Lachnospiraceae bacterium PF1-22]|uniref:helix-turn-helix transcriptional regulator n=1 Tax=Ohessyouella blattaphilus TaxID=2949333 RepID=UPI003E21517F
MQTGRLFEIIYLLLDKKKMTATELAAHFEVSKRTILRDVETLSMAGIPIYTTQGKGGGISIMEGYVLNKTVLSEEEKKQILFALQGLLAVQTPDTKVVLDKLESLFGKTGKNWIEVDFSRWGSGDTDKYKFETLKSAILKNHAITFRYIGSEGKESERYIFPLKLIFKSKSWYLQGYCRKRGDYRTFKINRMLDIAETEDSFPDDKYSPPPLETPRMPSNSLSLLTLVFSPQSAYRVYDEFDEGCIHKNDDGSLRVSAYLPLDNWIYDYLRSYGNEVQIIEPESLREKFKNFL